ncbi:progonadoliberin-1-like [Syngnathus acus]|uniref:progonadoliberin-1-like n=1 Tax=Syngnathus acus TaxID=161584 RepID=UPI001885CC1B|nr:progonadoliberin-1-like [Syngnathus acus]
MNELWQERKPNIYLAGFAKDSRQLKEAFLLQQKSKTMKSLVLWLLILATSMQVIYSQHWSYGLNPGGKRELLLLDKQTNVPVIDGFRQVEKPCRVVACGHLSLFAKICRMNEFHGNAAGKQSGRRTF